MERWIFFHNPLSHLVSKLVPTYISYINTIDILISVLDNDSSTSKIALFPHFPLLLQIYTQWSGEINEEIDHYTIRKQNAMIRKIALGK